MSEAGGKKTPVAELIVGSSGLLLVLGVFGFLGYQEITQEQSPPDITLHVEAIQPARSGYLMMIRAKNHGSVTAAGLVVRGTLRDGNATVETSHMRFLYVPPDSERKGGLYFSHDPRTLDIVLQPEGYERP
jgi:uncharacterized protein (TIGR02588 family)